MMKIKKKRVKSKTKTSASIGNGWLTTDEEEIERRRLRSMEEKLTVKRIKVQAHKNETIYGDYLVSSDDSQYSSSQYLVEYRDKQQYINGCSCPDYQINGLATCKHVERVSRSLLRKKIPVKRTCTEVFINRGGINRENKPVIKILWADKLRANSKVKKLLQPYFSSNNTLLLETLTAYNYPLLLFPG